MAKNNLEKSGLHFKVDSPRLLKEIAGNNGIGVLKIPLNVFQRYLGMIADRAIVLDDPILNELMCDMRLYELPEPTEIEYDRIMRSVRKSAGEQRRKEKG